VTADDPTFDDPGPNIGPDRARRGTRWFIAGFVLLVVVPLYLLMLSVVIRSDLLDLGGAPFTSDQFKALIAFLGVGVSATAAVLGVIVTKVTGDRTLAQEAEGQRRNELLERDSLARQRLEADRVHAQAAEAQTRQALETAVQVLNLIKNEGGYAGKAVTGGALTTLVHLGHHVIAMRTLQAALREDAVDMSTAVWLIDQVLQVSTSADSRDDLVASKQDAAGLLVDYVHRLSEDSRPGLFDWPSCAFGRWPTSLDPQAGWSLMLALLKLLTSRPAEFWTAEDHTWSWVIFTLDQLAQDETGDPSLRQTAATYGVRLLEAHRLAFVQGVTSYVTTDEVRTRMLEISQSAPANPQMGVRLERWIAETRRGG
jgi:hypothetical protein